MVVEVLYKGNDQGSGIGVIQGNSKEERLKEKGEVGQVHQKMQCAHVIMWRKKGYGHSVSVKREALVHNVEYEKGAEEVYRARML